MQYPDRILITVDPVDSTWRYVLTLIPYLQSLKIKILLAVTGGTLRPSQEAELQALPQLTWACLPGKAAWMEDCWQDVNRTGAWLIRLANHFEPDIVHLNSYVHAALPWKAPILVTAQCCAISWWQAVKGTPTPDYLREYHRRVSLGLEAATGVVAATRHTLNTFYCNYGFQTPTKVIRHGRDFPEGPMPEKRPYILSAGRCWEESRNVMLLEAIADDLPWPVYITGEMVNPLTGEVVKLSRTQALGWLGEEGFQEATSNASILASPMLYEPFSYTVLEAAAAGCALVLGDVPAMREIWRDAAIFIQPDRPDLWRNQLQALCNDPVLCRKMGELARQKAQTYSGIEMAADYVEVYHSMLVERAAEAVPTWSESLEMSELAVA